MSDQQWDVLEFIQSFRNDAVDGHQLQDAVDALSPEQIEELRRLLLEAEDSI